MFMRGYFKALTKMMPDGAADVAKMLHALVPDSLRYGSAYRCALELLEESQWWSHADLIAYQETLLKNLVTHCYTRVPYYKEVFTRAGLTPADIKTISDIRKIPFLTKQLVRENKKKLLAQGFSRFHRESELTSGSTGQPLDFVLDAASRGMERALALRHLLWLGYVPGDVIVEIKSHDFANPRRIFSYSPISHLVRCSAFRMDEEKLHGIHRTLQRFKPRFIKGYPSTLYLFARWMEKNHKTSVPVRYCTTSSETLYPFMRDQIERSLGCKVIDHYGQNEQAAYAFQCSQADGYHLQMEQSIVELISAEAGQHEIVGTSLHNMVMPFLRYRTGDFATKETNRCACGRKHDLLTKIKGKHGDIIVTPEGNLVSVVAMTYAFDHFEEFKEGRIIQEDVNTLTVQVVPWQKLEQASKDALLAKFNYFLKSQRMRINIEEVGELPHVGRGKKPFVISHLKLEDYV